jgi:hypothetical protein
LLSLLDEYRPSVSNLPKGRIAQVSIEKLLCYADRLRLEARISIMMDALASRRFKHGTLNATVPSDLTKTTDVSWSGHPGQ